jgi:hypothetical protein
MATLSLRLPCFGTVGMCWRSSAPSQPSSKPVSKAQRRPAEYDRFGGVGISMAGLSKSPSKPLLPEHRIHVLLLSANDLSFRAKNLKDLHD